mmetsp:Transcript_13526/g.36624  ORF Transcript_13526/g.36624 Transcript_13526/m.36624 type:complete len:318 (-) Transcript_13526:32-985(-)
MATDAEQLGARVALAAQASKPAGSPPQDGGAHSNSLHIGDGGGAPIQTNVGREWGLQTGLALLALKGLQQRRFLSADVRARAIMYKQVKVNVRAARVLAQLAGSICLLNCPLQIQALLHVLPPDVDVAGPGTHGCTCDHGALNELMRLIADDLTVLACSRLRLISIHHDVGWPTIRDLGHEAVLEARVEPCATSTSQPRLFNLVDEPVTTLVQDVLGAVVITSLLGTLKKGIVPAINVGEDAVFIFQPPKHSPLRHRGSSLGCCVWSCCCGLGTEMCALEGTEHAAPQSWEGCAHVRQHFAMRPAFVRSSTSILLFH